VEVSAAASAHAAIHIPQTTEGNACINHGCWVRCVTIFLIVVNATIWGYEVSLGDQADRFIQQYGLTPFRFVTFSRHQGGFIIGMILIILIPKNPSRRTPSWYDDRSWGSSGFHRR
jgi:hypothetical protein